MDNKKELDQMIGARIKKAREAAGLTQDRFGELVRMGPKNVSAVERGMVGVSLLTLRRICKVLAISSDYLLFGCDEKETDAGILSERLTLLPQEQFAIVRDIVNKLLEAFALR